MNAIANPIDARIVDLIVNPIDHSIVSSDFNPSVNSILRTIVISIVVPIDF